MFIEKPQCLLENILKGKDFPDFRIDRSSLLHGGIIASGWISVKKKTAAPRSGGPDDRCGRSDSVETAVETDVPHGIAGYKTENFGTIPFTGAECLIALGRAGTDKLVGHDFHNGTAHADGKHVVADHAGNLHLRAIAEERRVFAQGDVALGAGIDHPASAFQLKVAQSADDVLCLIGVKVADVDGGSHHAEGHEIRIGAAEYAGQAVAKNVLGCVNQLIAGAVIGEEFPAAGFHVHKLNGSMSHNIGAGTGGKESAGNDHNQSENRKLFHRKPSMVFVVRREVYPVRE